MPRKAKLIGYPVAAAIGGLSYIDFGVTALDPDHWFNLLITEYLPLVQAIAIITLVFFVLNAEEKRYLNKISELDEKFVALEEFKKIAKKAHKYEEMIEPLSKNVQNLRASIEALPNRQEITDKVSTAEQTAISVELNLRNRFDATEETLGEIKDQLSQITVDIAHLKASEKPDD